MDNIARLVWTKSDTPQELHALLETLCEDLDWLLNELSLELDFGKQAINPANARTNETKTSKRLNIKSP